MASNDRPAAEEWVTYQGDRCHTGYVAATLDPATFRRVWVDTLAAAGVPLSPVVTGGGNVYVTNSPYSGAKALTVVAAATAGSQRWFATTNQNDQWTPAVSGKPVYLYDGYPAGGRLALSKTQGVLYIAHTSGQLTAIAVR